MIQNNKYRDRRIGKQFGVLGTPLGGPAVVCPSLCPWGVAMDIEVLP